MIIRKVNFEEKQVFNQLVDHPIQTWEWGDFKEKTGMRTVRLGLFEKNKMIKAYQVLFRPIPKTPFTVGHCLRSSLPDKRLIAAFLDLIKEENAIFIKLEPDYIVRRWKTKRGSVIRPAVVNKDLNFEDLGLIMSKKVLYDNDSFELDLTKSKDELLANMHNKTRYNIRLSKRKGVQVKQRSDKEGLDIFLKLFEETLKRQKFYFHSPDYFKKMWPILHPAGIAHILTAEYKNEVLAAWMLFVFKNRLFYPYGASSSAHRELMASNLICWEAILFGKQKGCTIFDMWGGLGADADKNNPWYGFHRFKIGYGPDLIEYAGSWDLATNRLLYSGVQIADLCRWKFLRLRQALPF